MQKEEPEQGQLQASQYKVCDHRCFDVKAESMPILAYSVREISSVTLRFVCNYMIG